MLHLSIALILSVSAAGDAVEVAGKPGQAPRRFVEIHGLAAGDFNPDHWKAGVLHFLPDARTPLLEPRLSGGYRNIYAPSAVQTPEGWRLFYGAWDGVHTGNDRIYCVDTPDFLDFGARRTIIENGDFHHVCNVNAFRNPDGAYEMMCTVYPDENGMNKPAYFRSPDGETWNGVPAPYPAQKSDIVEIEGYKDFPGADINGMNVLLREGDQLRLYHCDFKNFGAVYRASGSDGHRYASDGPVLDHPQWVNDVKILQASDGPYYLMGLHQNGDKLWYSLSRDGERFDEPVHFASNLGPADRYIVAIGWVLRDNAVLGALYGAGEVNTLNRNRIFARWLQKRVVFAAEDGDELEATQALGPDRALIEVGDDAHLKGRLRVYAEDGKTLLATSEPVELLDGQILQLTLTTDR